MTTALYARVSTAQQAREQTIASQLAALRQHAAAHGQAVDDAHHYLDDGYSGTRLDRPGLDRLRDAARAGLVDRVLVHAPDRLARDYVWQQVVIADLARHGCVVEFVHGPSQQTPEDRLLLQMQGMFAEYERAQILERTRRGRLHRARQGLLLVGQAPYGYRRTPARGGQPAYLEVYEPEAAVVRQLYEWLLVEGLSVRQMTKRLRGAGVPPPQSNRWHPATVRNLVRNPAYGGTAYYNKTRTVEPTAAPAPERYRRRANSSTRPRPPEDWVPIAVPAIVAADLHEHAARQLRQNQWHAPRNTKYPYLLRGLVRCGACGLRMDCALQRSKPNPAGERYEYPYYACKGRDPLTAGRLARCEARRVRADRLDEAVWQQVRELVLAPERLAAQLGRAREGASLEDGVLAQQVARLRQLAARQGQQQARLLDAYQQGVIALDELAARREQLARQLADTAAQLGQLEQERQVRAQHAPMLEALEGFRARIAAGLAAAEADVDARQHLVRLLLEDVVITGDDVAIHYVVPLADFSQLRPLDRGREQAPEADRGRPDPGQADAAGGGHKKAVKPAQRRELVQFLRVGFKVSERRACRVIPIPRSSQRYQSQAKDQSALKLRLRDLAQSRVRYGYRRLHVLLEREGWHINHKRVYRLYRLEGLSLRLKSRKKRVSGLRGPKPVAMRPNECWSMDFMADRLVDGHRFRVLTLVDNVSRVSPAIVVDSRLTGERVVEALDWLLAAGHKPAMLSIDNGPEFISRALDAWAHRHGVRLEFSRPGKPTDNAFIEAFNSRFRDECLNLHWFDSLEEAQTTIEAWRVDYNTERPHGALGQQTPAEFSTAWRPHETVAG